MNKKIKLFLIYIFFIIIMAPSVFMFLGYSYFDENLEMRNKNSKPILNIETIGMFPENYESYFNDNFAFRSNFLYLNSWIKLKIFKTSPTKKVIKGKNGLYFYTGGNNINILRNLYLLTEKEFEIISKNQKILDEYFNKMKIDYVLVLIPSKVSVYPENLIGFHKTAEEDTLIDELEKYLLTYTNVKIINVKKTLINEKENMQVFFSLDSHWNYQGAYIGYKKIMEELKRYSLIDNIYDDVKFQTDVHPIGDLGMMVGGPGLLPKETVQKSILNNTNSISIEDHFFDELSNIANKEEKIREIRHIVNKKSLNNTKIQIFHDSFLSNFNFPNLLSENFLVTDMFWSWNPKHELIIKSNPDIVIIAITERLINNLLIEPDKSILEYLNKK